MTHCGFYDLLEDELLCGALFKSRCPAIGNLQTELVECSTCPFFLFNHFFSPRFFGAAETATTDKMSSAAAVNPAALTPPKRTSAGYYLALVTPAKTPSMTWTSQGTWAHSTDFATWATDARQRILGELLSHGSWFSKPPRQEVLNTLFKPWISVVDGKAAIVCETPKAPGTTNSTGRAFWKLQGILMSSTQITPVWTIDDYQQDDVQDTISLFGDDDDVEGIQETREINIEDIDAAPPAGITHIRSREWEARKFLAKERVRESRLKAQIAKRLALKEESRFYRQFGDLEDAESHFSEYDLTDHEDSDSDSDTDDEEEELRHV
jgi:hypothetical protein